MHKLQMCQKVNGRMIESESERVSAQAHTLFELFG